MTKGKKTAKARESEKAPSHFDELLRTSAPLRRRRAKELQALPAGAPLTSEDEAILAEERDCMTFWAWVGVVLILAACALMVLLIVASGAGWIDFAAGCEPFCETGKGMN